MGRPWNPGPYHEAIPVWLGPLTLGGGAGNLTFVGGKEQAVENKRRISGDSLYETMVSHNLKGISDMGIL